MLSTLAGKARLLFSDTSAAAVTCAIMKPELTPLSCTRKGGRPLIFGSTSTAVRRSEIEPTSHSAMASMSAAKATGWAWKLPPDTPRPRREDERIVGDRIGFDLQRARGVAHEVEAGAHHLRLAAEAVGVLHLAAIGVEAADLAALEQALQQRRDAICPGWPRSFVEARIEGGVGALQRVDDSAPATSAEANTARPVNRRRARWRWRPACR
jgi:hypothetical protein